MYLYDSSLTFFPSLPHSNQVKHFGSSLEFTRERNRELLRAFRRECAKVSHVRLREIGIRVVNSPAPRFWVSEYRAMVVCSQLARGIPVLDTMRPTKREMFTEIYRRVCDLKRRQPNRPLIDLASEVVNSPAPKFYMEPSSALERLFKIRRGWYDNNHNSNKPNPSGR